VLVQQLDQFNVIVDQEDLETHILFQGFQGRRGWSKARIRAAFLHAFTAALTAFYMGAVDNTIVALACHTGRPATQGATDGNDPTPVGENPGDECSGDRPAAGAIGARHVPRSAAARRDAALAARPRID
jgi:hypothetical protein